MKTKPCATCSKIESVLYRIQINNSKGWLFVCKNCCSDKKTEINYKYGGTWKGTRH